MKKLSRKATFLTPEARAAAEAAKMLVKKAEAEASMRGSPPDTPWSWKDRIPRYVYEEVLSQDHGERVFLAWTAGQTGH